MGMIMHIRPQITAKKKDGTEGYSSSERYFNLDMQNLCELPDNFTMQFQTHKRPIYNPGLICAF